MATESDTSGLKTSPSTSFGLIIPKTGPINNPATAITTIAGSWKRHAVHCEAMPSVIIITILSNSDSTIIPSLFIVLRKQGINHTLLVYISYFVLF